MWTVTACAVENISSGRIVMAADRPFTRTQRERRRSTRSRQKNTRRTRKKAAVCTHLYRAPAHVVIHPVVGGERDGQQGRGHDGQYGGQRESDRGTRHDDVRDNAGDGRGKHTTTNGNVARPKRFVRFSFSTTHFSNTTRTRVTYGAAEEGKTVSTHDAHGRTHTRTKTHDRQAERLETQ